jgi:nitroreductase
VRGPASGAPGGDGVYATWMESRASAATVGWVESLAALRPEPAADGAPPEPDDLTRILTAATTVPDHGGLRPWRFALVVGEGRERFGEALVAGLTELRGTDLPGAVVDKMRHKAFAAPCAVVVIATPDPTSNVEVWEQVASASCTGYALVLAATGLGYGAVWKSAPVLEAAPVRDLFGLAEHDRLLGWVNLGSPAPLSRKKLSPSRPGLDQVVTVVAGESHPYRVTAGR